MNIQPATARSIEHGAKLLREGQLVAFATETVYGLGGNALNDETVAEIFAVKGRPQFNPLIIHVSDVEMAKHIVQWNERANVLADAFWPGPLTLVLKKSANCTVSLLASCGGDTLGVRIPAADSARQLIKAAGIPIAAPSANRSGRVSPTTAQHVRDELGDAVALIIDAGPCDVGIESTVLDISGDNPVLLRPGYVTAQQIETALNCKLTPMENDSALRSPGMLASHYAPYLAVKLNISNPGNTEALIAFGSKVPVGAKTIINLSEKGDLKEAAAQLFAALRKLDRPEYTAIAVMPIPEEGLGVAINDRLKRAATR
jgi:L-threonylcarbamoyladenylate synthase